MTGWSASPRWGALQEDLIPDPCAYVNRTRRALKAAAPDHEQIIAACAEAFVKRMMALDARDKVRLLWITIVPRVLQQAQS